MFGICGRAGVDFADGASVRRTPLPCSGSGWSCGCQDHRQTSPHSAVDVAKVQARPSSYYFLFKVLIKTSVFIIDFQD